MIVKAKTEVLLQEMSFVLTFQLQELRLIKIGLGCVLKMEFFRILSLSLSCLHSTVIRSFKCLEYQLILFQESHLEYLILIIWELHLQE